MKLTYDDILNGLDKATVPEGRGKEAIWNRIEEKMVESPREPKVKPFNPMRYWAAASVLLVAIATYLLWPDQVVLTETQLGEIRKIELPDGSSVQVNADSKIEYSGDWDREVRLDGEAFFEVSKGEKFIVTTAQGSVSVLGTSFNVKQRGPNLLVACKTGRVQVDIPSKKFSQVLMPGQMVRFENDTVKRANQPIDLMGTWISGEFYFENADLEDVVEELIRQFAVSIELKSEGKKFTGYFKGNDLNLALETVCLPLSLTYSRTTEGTILIR